MNTKKSNKPGNFFDAKKTVEDLKKVFPYFRIEEGRDDVVRHGNQYAHPYAAEAMSEDAPEKLEAMEKQVSPFTAVDELVRLRDEMNEMTKKNWERINAEHPEFEEYGWWEEYEVDGCVEEPDAPKVKVLVRRLRENFKKGPYPVLIPIAVGGLFNNSPWMHSNAPITKFLGCQLVVPMGRTYPDAQYPALINDYHAVYQWMIDHAEMLNIDTDKVVIWGSSSGGHIAAALPFRLKRYNWCGGPMPRGVVTYDGFYDDRETTRSMRMLDKGWSGLVNRAANMRYMGTNFASGFIGPEAYANHALVEECKGLPPYAIYENQDCPGCDPAIEFMEKLNEVGGYCSFYMGGGCTHTGPFEALNKIGAYYIREDDYEPELGTDRVSRMAAFTIGNVKDFFEYDLRRQ